MPRFGGWGFCAFPYSITNLSFVTLRSSLFFCSQKNRFVIAGLIFKSIIEQRLATAGLFGRKGQLHAETFQDISHVLKCGSVELVTEAGDEKLGLGHGVFAM